MRLFSDHYVQALDTGEQAWVETVRVLCRDQLGPRARPIAVHGEGGEQKAALPSGEQRGDVAVVRTHCQRPA